MAETIVIDLSQRYAAAFGFLASKNTPASVSLTKDQSNYKLDTFDTSETEFENISFEYDNKTINFAALPFAVSADKTIKNVLAPPPIISFTKSKQLIETPVNDSDNVVVERWGTKSWDIRMRGLLIDVESRQYPEKLIPKLHRLFEFNNVVKVSGTQFFDKEIANVYLKSIEINGVQGFQDTVQFSLQLTSIKAISYTLTNP